MIDLWLEVWFTLYSPFTPDTGYLTLKPAKPTSVYTLCYHRSRNHTFLGKTLRTSEQLPPQTLPLPPADLNGKMESPTKVRVSVMIAMPSQHPVILSKKEVQEAQQVIVEEGLSHLGVGSVEVDLDGAGALQEEKEADNLADGKRKRSMSRAEAWRCDA
ncbi:hypothetical protein PQX77_019298 [Marasmius sp. AFHP31]|nr:hypothetical protein PQX77_019298 [Marasmius sp. AFHP31]